MEIKKIEKQNWKWKNKKMREMKNLKLKKINYAILMRVDKIDDSRTYKLK